MWSSVMEWNPKTPLQWDWENLVTFNGKTSEIPKQIQPTDWGIEGDRAIDSGSLYSSGGGALSGSDFGNGSSSKSSLSASVDSSLKGGIKLSEFNFESVEGFPKHPSQTKESEGVEHTIPSPTLGVSVSCSEPLIGLRLGKRTYFEDVCAGTTVKPSFSVIPTSSTAATKRSRASYQSIQTPRCQVEGCDLDLTSAKDYHRRHRVCENHSKCPKVTISGLERRFCQQCSRFHDLTEFDEKKRSCRRRLSDHNARRRKPQPEAIQFNSARLSSPFYDGRQQMSIMLNRIPLVHTTKPAMNSIWEGSCSFKPVQEKGSLIRPAKTGTMDVQLHLPNNDLPNSILTRHDSDRLLSFKGTTAEVLNQGLEASVIASNLDPTPDLRRALSLLSTNSWSSGDPEPSSLDQLMHANHTSYVQPVTHTGSHGWPFASLDYWQGEHQQASQPRMHSLNPMQTSNSQFQEFQLFKTPFEDGFYSNQMN